MKITYISGPTTGIKDLNRRSFKSAYFKLKNGRNVINPHDIGDKLFVPGFFPTKIKWFIYIFFDVLVLLFCRKIYMLEGWEKSSGATVELKVAKFLKMEVEYEDLGKPFNLGCEKCGEQFEGYYNNFPCCPKCGETEKIQWALKRTHTHLVSDPENCKIENLKINVECVVKLPGVTYE